MRYYRLDRNGTVTLVARDSDTAYDLSRTSAGPTSITELASAARLADETIDEIAREHTDEAPTVTLESSSDDLLLPFDPDEVWAAGVTYSISQEARQEEGGLAEAYLDAYEADRPEIYLKATPSRTVGPGDAVGIRSDSGWDVPEPELTVVLFDGEIIGYSVGNDVCGREIERQNLLYLPQSKIYTRSCAIGPCLATGETVGDPHDLRMELRIVRDGDTVFVDSTSTSEMVRTCEELAGYFARSNAVPQMTGLLTGTSIIPPSDVTLVPDDTVYIEIENIGTLENTVETV